MSPIADERRQQHFLNELEQIVRTVNREHIHKKLPELSRKDISRLIRSVAAIRADYLEAAVALGRREGEMTPDGPDVKNLQIKREMFEEGRAAYESLVYAIERGYLDVDELNDD